jgi:hypothetical protein
MRIGSVFALVLYLLRTQIGASDLVYLVEPLLKWQRTLPGGGSINGAYIAPNRNNLFVISSVCTVQALDPRSGESVWTYQPGNPSTCSGGVTFSDGVGTPYLTFIESTINLGPTPFSTQVVILDLNSGVLLAKSAFLSGQGAGEPQTTEDGRYIVATSNTANIGTFVVIDTNAVENGIAPIVFEESNPSGPFSPVGFYHRPTTPIFFGGNKNDVFVWAFDLTQMQLVGTEAIENGQIFSFQFPSNYANNGGGLSVKTLGPKTSWKASTRPLLSNGGKSMHWANSDGRYRVWINRTVDDSPTTVLSLPRGIPTSVSAHAAPVLGQDETNPFVYLLGPNPSVFRSNTNLTTSVGLGVDSLFTGQILLSPKEEYMYIATEGRPETSRGILYQIKNEENSLTVDWLFRAESPMSGDLARSTDGTTIFFGQRDGTVSALEVAEAEEELPSSTPASAPVFAPAVCREIGEICGSTTTERPCCFPWLCDAGVCRVPSNRTDPKTALKSDLTTAGSIGILRPRGTIRRDPLRN